MIKILITELMQASSGAKYAIIWSAHLKFYRTLMCAKCSLNDYLS